MFSRKNVEWLSTEKALFFNAIMQDHTAENEPWKRLMSCSRKYYFTHTAQFLFIQITSTHLTWQKIWKIGWYSMCLLQVFVQKPVFFMGMALKIYTLFDKNFLVKMVITSLIKNKKNWKNCMFECNIKKRHYFPASLTQFREL